MKGKIFAALAVAVFTLAGAPTLVHATITNTTSPNAIFDDFSDPLPSPNTSLPWDYWYEDLVSADSVGYLKQENIGGSLTCNNAVCVTNETEGTTKLLRMALYPEVYPGTFNLAQIGDNRDGFSYNIPHRWLPTVNHPVVMQARFRASSNYNIDGSGGAKGTFGFWLQNDANELTAAAQANPSRDGSFNDHSDNLYSMGFNWADENTLGGLFKGFKATAVDKLVYTGPLLSTQITGVNINDWTDLKLVWSVNILGVQSVTYYVNNSQVAYAALPLPAPSMSVIAWSDNEEPQLGASGIVYTYANPTSQQNFDIDYLSVSQQ